MTEVKKSGQSSRSSHKNKYITFFLDSEEYGVEIYKVKEIIGIMDITSVPSTPTYIKGVLNLRGKIVPIIDLRLKFGLEFKEYADRTSIIVIEMDINGKITPIGIVVDTVEKVLQINEEDIEETPSFGVNINTEFILGMAKVEDTVKILLNINKILTSEELTFINKISGDKEIE